MSFRLAQPYFLTALLLIPIVLYYARKTKGLSKWRYWTILSLRLIIILSIIFALSEVEVIKKSDELTVIYSLDMSKSIPAETLKNGMNFITASLKNQDKNSKSGIVVFGAEPSIESSPQKALSLTKIESIVDKDKTNIASALKLCLAAFPKYSQKRIVLLSDGNQNIDDAVQTAEMISDNKTQLLVFPLYYEKTIDLAINKMEAPQSISVNTPFDVKIIISSPIDTKAKLLLYKNNALEATEEVSLSGGKKNLFSIQQTIPNQGVFVYRAEVSSADDVRIENNVGYTFTQVKGEPSILFVDGDSFEKNSLVDVLLSQKLKVDRISPKDFPDSIEQLQSYDAVILSNVHASKLSSKQAKMVEGAVHDLGIGLLMIGGENSFGAGGWQDTMVEKALPVSMDIKQKKILPNGALVIILHTCEIPDGNKWAQDISLSALNVLSSKDMMGIVYYGAAVGGFGAQVGATGNPPSSYGEQWLFPLQEVGNKELQRSLIMQVAPGDMPNFEPTMKMAYENLKKVNCQVKHIVIISDGDPPAPSEELSQKIRSEKITISTVVIAPHTPRDVEVMRAVANWGGGNFYQPASSNELPRIFIKEASIVRKSLIFEKPFTPKIKNYSEILTGFKEDEIPILNGYVCTTAKNLSVESLTSNNDDPILSHWRYGLGKAVAFTSDAKEKWAANWLSWDKYVKFWLQVVRWTLRETSSRNFQIAASIEGNEGRLLIEAVDDSGEFINFLEFDGKVITPEIEKESVYIRQTASGRYEGNFLATKPGSYIISAYTKDKAGNGVLVTGGVSLSYSQEYADNRTDILLLEKLAKEGGGRLIKNTEEIYRHNLPSGVEFEPMWSIFVILSLLLLPLDIFFRRVMFEPLEVLEYINLRFGRFFGKKEAVADKIETTMVNLKKVKDKTQKDIKQKVEEGEKTQDALSKKLRGIDLETAEIKKDTLGELDIKTIESMSLDKEKKKSDKTTSAPSESEKEADKSAMDRLKEAKKRAQDKMRDE